MAAETVERRCRWCARRFTVTVGPGRPREFCRRSCRQRDYEARQRASEVGLSEHELVLTRQAMDDLRDRLYVLECAVEDVERDLVGAPTRAEYREALDWLLDAARPVVESLGREGRAAD
ncbi:MAG TPA: hypothetical protein DCS55_21550 [Acidimicrobiaceae bacterium]|nr:hypothetical protein [Acidimicrobiaceae bacterium]